MSSGSEACPCCKQLTLSERGGYEICPTCGWEDDGQDDADADVDRGGPNATSLTAARNQWAAQQDKTPGKWATDAGLPALAAASSPSPDATAKK